MKHERYLVFFLIFALGAFSGAFLFPKSVSPEVPACYSSVQPLFFPGSESEIRQRIDSAKESVWVEMYVFTYEPLQWALVDAKNRGVDVKVILEPRLSGNENQNLFTKEFLEENGIEVRWASLEYSLTHTKTVVIDGEEVIVGSTNWSKHAMLYNREDAVLISDPKIASEFVESFLEDWKDAT